jgi:hypothetical protein
VYPVRGELDDPVELEPFPPENLEPVKLEPYPGDLEPVEAVPWEPT